MAGIAPITLNDLTEAKVDGSGVFDTLMRAMVGHLELEFKQNRLRGADYAQVYLNALTPVLQNSVVFLLQKDEAANKALLVQAQIELTQAQKDLVLAELEREILNRDLIAAQVERTKQETKNLVETNAQIIAQTCLLKAQYDIAMLTKLQTSAQTTLIQQKTATEKAQTVETGVDDNSVVGRQKLLYKAQTDGFQRDAEQKAAKLLADTWNVRRTTDEGTVADTTNRLDDATIGRAITKMLEGVNA